MIPYYAISLLFILSFLLSVLLFNTKKSLTDLQRESHRYFSVQNSFSKAVAGMGVHLENEKWNTSRLLQILETIHDGVALMDQDGRLRYANSALWRLYQIMPSDRKRYLNDSWINLHSPKGQGDIISKVLPVLEANRVWMGESNVMTQKGEMIRAELYIAKSDAGYIGFIRNVSCRYEAEQENRKLSIQLHELKKYEAMERVMRNLVHEFSNSLSAIMSLSELIGEEVEKGSVGAMYTKKLMASSGQMQTSLEKARSLMPNAQKFNEKFNEFYGFPATTKATLSAGQRTS